MMINLTKLFITEVIAIKRWPLPNWPFSTNAYFKLFLYTNFPGDQQYSASRHQDQVHCPGTSSCLQIRDWSSWWCCLQYWDIHQQQWLCSKINSRESCEVRSVQSLHSWFKDCRLLYSMRAVDELGFTNEKLFDIWKKNKGGVNPKSEKMKKIIEVSTMKCKLCILSIF